MSVSLKVANAGLNPYCMESCHPQSGMIEGWMAMKKGQMEPEMRSDARLTAKEFA